MELREPPLEYIGGDTKTRLLVVLLVVVLFYGESSTAGRHVLLAPDTLNFAKTSEWNSANKTLCYQASLQTDEQSVFVAQGLQDQRHMTAGWITTHCAW